MKIQTSPDLARTLIASTFIILLSAGSFWVLRPFLPAILWAFTIVVATWPLLMSLQTRFRLGRKTATLVMMVVLGLVVLLPLALAFMAIVSNADVVINWTRNLSQIQISAPPVWLQDWPILGAKISGVWERLHAEGAQFIIANIQPYIKIMIAWFFGSLGSVGMFFVHLLITFILMGVLFSSGEKVTAAVTRFARRVAGDQGESSVILAGQSIRAVALGIVVTAALQSSLAGIALYVAGVPRVGIIMAFVVVFCVAQTGPFIPMLAGVAWLYSQNESIAGTLLLIWGAVLGLSDNFLRPMLIRRGANLPFLLIFSGVVGGLIAFGIVGLFIGPLILAITYRLLQAWVAEEDAAESFVSYTETSATENRPSLPH